MQVLHKLPAQRDENLLVGTETADDAGVYKISDGLAVISTLDFFPPIVDDPYTFGAVSAANALSDVYAMGGEPRLALNIVCFPRDLGLDVLNEIIRGGMDKLKEAGVLLLGGHSVEDHEVKYGLSVTGFVHPDKLTKNSTARPGDVLVLTKPIGVGVITSAVKAGKLKPEEAGPVFSSMATLNREASVAMVEAGASACTDVTGYGLLGHAMEVARGSGVTLVIRSNEVPFFPGAIELVGIRKLRPRTIAQNMEFHRKDIDISGKVKEEVKLLLFDPQTSGGLLISIPAKKSGMLLRGMEESGVKASVIGEVDERKEGPFIRVE